MRKQSFATLGGPFPGIAGMTSGWSGGRTEAGDLLQVVYILDEDDRVFVIHARPLTKNEKRRYRRRQK